MALREVLFAEKDLALIENQIITLVEQFLTVEGQPPVKLQRIDPRRLFLQVVTYVLSLQRNIIDHTGKMNLLYYATGDFLDHIGFMLGVTRLLPKPALTTLQYELSEALSFALIIPKGTRATPDGKQYFQTTIEAEVKAGETTVNIPAECTMVGIIGNGWLEGQINQFVDRLAWIKSVKNITVSSGGADTETDDNLRDRIQLAPELFSVAGPTGAYVFWARSAHQSIIDVAVIGPPQISPGCVELYPLMLNGEIPTQDILDLVYASCNADDVRPLTDYVSTLPPTAKPYDLTVTYWINRTAATQATALQAAVETATQDFIVWQRSKLGRDLNPSELNHRMVAAGAKRTEIASPVFTVLERAELSIPANVSVTFGGLEDD